MAVLFATLDPGRIADNLSLKAAAQDRGARNEPPTTSTTFDEIEARILERIQAERTAAHAAVVDQFRIAADRLANLDFEGRFAEIRHAAPAVVSEFKAEAATGRDELHGLRRRLTEHEAEKDAFKARHRLDRTPRPPSAGMQTLKFGLVALLMMIETVLNGSFLAKGSELGQLGGTTEAFAYAVLNVAGSFLFGRLGLPELSHRNILRKLIGLLSLAAFVVFAVALNLALAHYREVSGGLVTGGGEEVMRRLAEAPLAFADVKSWLFAGIGFLFAIIAFIDGYATVDPYPGFGDIERRLNEARDTYIRRKQDLIDTLLEVRDDYIESMQDANRDLSVRRGEYEQILEQRARLARLFDQHQSHLQAIADTLLAIYREANQAARTTPAPARFSDGVVMERVEIAAELPADDGRADLRRRIEEAQALLEREVGAMHQAFDAAVAGYHQIDDVVREDRHVARAA
ncbi:MAG TPA: hypothetical protein VMP03_16305 [Methylomirabilota bacterium]|nr:hypothetical protein [Methylomirabilota bacterium]